MLVSEIGMLNKKQDIKRDQNTLALALLDYAVKKNILQGEETERIITTAARYLGNPFVRETFGIVSARSDQNVKLNVTCAEFDRVVTRFCVDLFENTIVNSRTRREDWLAYARQLIEEGVAPRDRVEVHLLQECEIEENTLESIINDSDNQQENGRGPLDQESSENEQDKEEQSHNEAEGEDDGVQEQEDGNNEDQGGNKKNPDTRKYIIPSDFKVSIESEILRRVYNEMRHIEVNDKPLAVALVTRAFLENIYGLFYEKNKEIPQRIKRT